MRPSSAFTAVKRLHKSPIPGKWAIGSREPAKIAAAMHASLPVAVQNRTKFIVEDCNDTEFSEVLMGINFDKLIIFCNNLAFHAGTVQRY